MRELFTGLDKKSSHQSSATQVVYGHAGGGGTSTAKLPQPRGVKAFQIVADGVDVCYSDTGQGPSSILSVLFTIVVLHFSELTRRGGGKYIRTAALQERVMHADIIIAVCMVHFHVVHRQIYKETFVLPLPFES